MFPYASTSHWGTIFGVISGLRWGGYITWSQAQLKEGPPGAAFTSDGGSAASMGAVTSSLVRLATAHHRGLDGRSDQFPGETSHSSPWQPHCGKMCKFRERFSTGAQLGGTG